MYVTLSVQYTLPLGAGANRRRMIPFPTVVLSEPSMCLPLTHETQLDVLRHGSGRGILIVCF